MEAKLLDKQPTSAKFEVTVPAERVDEAFESVFRAISREVRVPGFRPGKAPRGVLLKRIGEDALAQEVRDALVEENYPKAVRSLELTPLHAHFHAHEPKTGEAYTFEVHVDLYPEFTLPDLEEIIVDTAPEPLTEEMVTAAVEELRREHATLTPVERPAEAGDYVLVETLADGQPSGNVLPVDMERVAPALAEQLLGKAMGDEVTLELGDLAEDDEDDDYDEDEYDEEDDDAYEADAGDDDADDDGDDADEADDEDNEDAEDEASLSPRTLTVVVKDIKAREKPEADDEFAATLGFETWDEVLEQVRRNLTAQLEANAFEAQREEFVDKLVAETEVSLPAVLVNRRKATMLQGMASDLKERGVALETYVASLDERGERETFEAELQASAEGAVRRDLVLEKLLEARGTRLGDQEFEEAVRYMASRQGQDPARFRQGMGQDWLDGYRFLLTRDKAVREALRERLGVTDDDETDTPDTDPDGVAAGEHDAPDTDPEETAERNDA